MREQFFRRNRGPSRPWYKHDGARRLQTDRLIVSEYYPTLKYFLTQDEEVRLVILAECGIPSNISTRVTFPWNYPQSEPQAFDAKQRFQAWPGKRLIDRHILKDGKCCLWLPPRSPWSPGDSTALRGFLDEVAVFFDRQLVADVTGDWPGPQYAHGQEGYSQFARERLLEEGVSQTANLSDVINMTKDTDSYALCPCGSQKKFKFCHQSVVEKIRREIGLGTIRRLFSGSEPELKI
jgi:hypothetical protein